MATSKRKTASEPVTNAAAEPSSDGRDSEIARRAYDRYQRSGCVDGHDLDDWFAAEREFESAAPVVRERAIVAGHVRQVKLADVTSSYVLSDPP